MNYFTYNGVKSSDMGIRIESKNVFSSPKYDVAFESIPGRHGDLIMGGGRYPNVQITYSVFVPAKTVSELASKITAIKGWLYAGQNAYHELTDTYDNAFFRKAVFASNLDIEDELNRIGTFTVSFSCLPFRYSSAGQTPVTISTAGQSLDNPYKFASYPLIRVNGSGDGSITLITNSSLKIWQVKSVDGYVDIDSEQMNCFKGTVLKNDKVSGTGFPLLEPGTNYIVFSGGVTSVKITPRWCTL